MHCHRFQIQEENIRNSIQAIGMTNDKYTTKLFFFSNLWYIFFYLKQNN